MALLKRHKFLIIGVISLIFVFTASGLYIADKKFGIFSEKFWLADPSSWVVDGDHVMLLKDIEISNPLTIPPTIKTLEIDLNGHEIRCSVKDKQNNPLFVGFEIIAFKNIAIENKNITIKNGSIKDCYSAIHGRHLNGIKLYHLNLTENLYMGIDVEGENIFIKNNELGSMKGKTDEAYTVGINIFCNNNCIIESNNFIDFYRSKHVQSTNISGEGVGVIIRNDSQETIIKDNYFTNQYDTNHGAIAVWLGDNSYSEIKGNKITGFERGIVGAGHAKIQDNSLTYLWAKGDGKSYGIKVGENSTVAGNQIEGYETPE